MSASSDRQNNDENHPSSTLLSAKNRVPGRRRWLFRLTAILLPILLLLVIEVIGRLLGFGGIPSVLSPMDSTDGKTLVGIQPEGVQSFFFAGKAGSGRILSSVFTMPKESDTLRIFLVGGSAAQGYPQPRNLTVSSFLEAMLGDVWPDRRVEVINLGVVAVASFPVRCIYEEAIHYDPDLMIVYTGNNEFYGAQGTASVHLFGRTPQAMRLFRASRRLAFLQMFDDLFRRSGTEVSGKGMMEVVMADQQIPIDDPRRPAAERNLGANITDMIAMGHSMGVPTLVCTLPGNERDMFPLGEDPPPPLSEAERARFASLLDQGRQLIPNDPQAALAKLREASTLHQGHALLHYLMGLCLTATGADADALTEYARATDLDSMPWRAPSGSNRAVRAAAADAGAVGLCDLQAVFRAQSPGGSIGWELMDDHVHPSLRGQAEMARAMVQSLTQLEGTLHVNPDAAAGLPDWTAYAKRLGATPYDDYSVTCSVLALFDLPFFKRSNPPAEQRSLARRAALERMMSPAEQDAARGWARGLTSRTGALPLVGVMGRIAFRARDFAKADRLLCEARSQLARLSPGTLEYGSMALEARAQLRPLPSPEDVALAEDMLDAGKTMIRLTGDRAPLSAWRDMGLASLRLGRRQEGIEYLSDAARRVRSPGDFAIVQILVQNLIEENDVPQARSILQKLASRPAIAKQCARLLQQLAGKGP